MVGDRNLEGIDSMLLLFYVWNEAKDRCYIFTKHTFVCRVHDVHIPKTLSHFVTKFKWEKDIIVSNVSWIIPKSWRCSDEHDLRILALLTGAWMFQSSLKFECTSRFLYDCLQSHGYHCIHVNMSFQTLNCYAVFQCWSWYFTRMNHSCYCFSKSFLHTFVDTSM